MEQENLKPEAGKEAAQLRIQLAQMTMASQMLERCAFDEKSRGYLAAMNQGICRMLRIVGRMELRGRLDGEAPAVKLAPADLGELTGKLGLKMEGLLERAGVTLTVNRPEYLPARADRALIQQLLLELVANAAKAATEAKEGGRVTLTLKQDRDNAVFTVQDNGPGIPASKVPFLFDSAGEDVPEWRQGGGGIAIARRIAVLHGGRLIPLCEAGRGLVITASIPLNLGGDEELRDDGEGIIHNGGFDEAVVGLSHLLPAEVFAPGEYD